MVKFPETCLNLVVQVKYIENMTYGFCVSVMYVGALMVTGLLGSSQHFWFDAFGEVNRGCTKIFPKLTPPKAIFIEKIKNLSIILFKDVQITKVNN